MTIGTLIPLTLFAMALVEIPILLMLKQRGAVSPRALPMMLIATSALPLIAYLVLNFVMPDLGAMGVL
ncbi:hypothetical protein ACRAQ7_03880 [Erythrobacter sp. W53]|uniref:hypothetical protein n=1 Tax=Erythrobacter sp. W53 TaxID=3425947 RepID=UPI003D76A273